MVKNEFLIGDTVKVNKKYSRKKYIITAISENKEYAWIEAEKDKKFNLIKVPIKKLKLVLRNQISI
ncbi:MAG: hypothetical protein E7F58_11200 [Clostridium saudiense]|uniref:hypothetical protein n=1 Tax=Clostridium saudiense TaxID=1414720 RepID=UPI00220D4C47|nr:hypothetical protein [Clostridium saudiense]MDU3522206.1 hypothetical protein [Clostridium saudiense]UVX78408.1 MAG: hypothetical protein [Bacteriophage sp.]